MHIFEVKILNTNAPPYIFRVGAISGFMENCKAELDENVTDKRGHFYNGII